MDKLLQSIVKAIIEYLPHIVSAHIFVGVGILTVFILVRITRKIMTHRKFDPSLINFMCRTIRLVVYSMTAIAALSALKISTAGVVALITASFAAIAIALKDRLNDIASGIVILFSKPFVTGDFIVFGNYQGFVESIDVMHTKMRTLDGTHVIIPNSVISNAEVTNYTANPQIRVTVNVPIPYSADIKQVQKVLGDVIDNTDLVLSGDEYPRRVRLEKFGESAMEFSVRCYCEYKDFWPVYYALMEGSKNALDKNGIVIPFNQLDVHVKND